MQEPSDSGFGTVEFHSVLENIVQVDLPPAVAVENRDAPTGVGVRPKLFRTAVLLESSHVAPQIVLFLLICRVC
jgi:hypothetical protein